MSESISSLQPLKSKIGWRYQFQQYGITIIAALLLFVAFSIYLFYRRGYYDLYIANKVFANVAAILLGIVVLIGPASRLFSFYDRYVRYRKELGIIVLILAFIHSIVSAFFLPSKFPLSKFLEAPNWPFVIGLTAIIILVAIFLISNNRAMHAIGRDRWWKMQYWGVRLVFALVVLHVFIMKFDGWVKWYKVGGGKELVHPEWPGAGLLVGWFMVFVIFIRLAEFINPKFGKTAWHISTLTLPLIYIITFLWWG